MSLALLGVGKRLAILHPVGGGETQLHVLGERRCRHGRRRRGKNGHRHKVSQGHHPSLRYRRLFRLT